MSTSDVPDLTSHTVAWFRTSADLRSAEAALERQGIDSRYIEIGRPSVTRNRRQIDRRTWNTLGLRALLGVGVGVAVGAIVGLVIGLILGHSGSDLFGFVFALGIAGGPLGGIYMVATKLPTQEQSFDTFGGTEVGAEGQDWIAVGGPDELQSEAAQVLQGFDPVQIRGHAA